MYDMVLGAHVHGLDSICMPYWEIKYTENICVDSEWYVHGYVNGCEWKWDSGTWLCAYGIW